LVQEKLSTDYCRDQNTVIYKKQQATEAYTYERQQRNGQTEAELCEITYER